MMVGGWSPTGRALLVGTGTGLCVYGLTQHAPTACVLGTLGCILAAEGFTNAGIDDIACAANQLAEKAKGAVNMASDVASNVADTAKTKVSNLTAGDGKRQPATAAR